MRRSLAVVAFGLVVVSGASGCSGSGEHPGAPRDRAASGASAVSPTPSHSPEPVVTFSPATGSTSVRPDQQVRVTVANGVLTSVMVESGGGPQVAGGLDAAATTWTATAPLSGGSTYTVTAQARMADGGTRTFTSTFSTLKPSSTMSAVLLPGDDWVVGVGMPIIVQFARGVKNKDAAVKTLDVVTTPSVEGAWHWMNDESVWWRPRDFWPAGTKVKLTAAIGGAELAPGVWGRRTYTAQFSIGSSVISTVDTRQHAMTVTQDGQVVRVLPVTTGKDDPRFRTRNGTKVIMEKLESVRMDASTTGTDSKDPEFYDTVEYWAMRLTWSGEYLHARPGSDWAFGKVNISHGCTGMSNSNAKWLFTFSKVGDVVKYTGSSRPLEFGNGYTAWDMPFDQWAAPYGPSGGAASGSPSPSASGSAGSPPTTSSASTSSRTTSPAAGGPSGAPSSLAPASAPPVGGGRAVGGGRGL
ncbi:MAG TPA: Ig-like domain-containing protein [Kineosporiaceae bacterium]